MNIFIKSFLFHPSKHNISKDVIRTHRSKTGMTLIELIIASLIAVIVLASLASVDYSVRLMHHARGPRSMLSAETTAILQHIARNMQATIGDAGDLGIEITGGGRTLSIRQDQNATPTPADYTDDTWVYYDRNGHNVRYCQGHNACTTLLSNLGSGKIKDFSVTFTTNSDPAALDNQVIVTIDTCSDPNTCAASEFTATTTISVPSQGGDSI